MEGQKTEKESCLYGPFLEVVISSTIQYQMLRLFMNDELKSIWIEAAVI
jgi:hypothetical protein